MRISEPSERIKQVSTIIRGDKCNDRSPRCRTLSSPDGIEEGIPKKKTSRLRHEGLEMIIQVNVEESMVQAENSLEWRGVRMEGFAGSRVLVGAWL